MKTLYVKDIIKLTNDKQEIKIYENTENSMKFITRGNWFQDNILDYVTSDKQFHKICVLQATQTTLKIIVL